ncbi:hypothetical protein DM02DRAFT_625517 [Periconia macrospinosa]|uniref:Uncharacterized protein n=1 Tax=Periconia macrospinosa TaxID=97972 RepID=A0A2V1E2D1_9PLEO|nr:hypothetical protein DM02DRAFT_625517 [Periconia macrospinosa]
MSEEFKSVQDEKLFEDIIHDPLAITSFVQRGRELNTLKDYCRYECILLRIWDLTWHITLFITDNGRIGLTYHPDRNGVRLGDVVVGLFGVNLQFVLHPTEDIRPENQDTIYNMVNVAFVLDHEYLHDFIVDGPEDPDWEYLSQHGLREYAIV